MITHLVAVEESHLFLDGSINARVSRVQAYNKQSFIIKLFHQGELFLQIHTGGTAYGRSFFSIKGQFAGNKCPASIILSTKVVFPWSTWAMIAMFLMSCILYLYIWLQRYDFYSKKYLAVNDYFLSSVSSLLLNVEGVVP